MATTQSTLAISRRSFIQLALFGAVGTVLGTSCAPAVAPTPTSLPPVAAAPPTPIPPTPTQVPTPVAPTATAAPTQAPTSTATPQAKSTNDLNLTILFDNTTTDSRLKPAWGFAAAITYQGHQLLFDTGADAQIFVGNMEQLSIDPRSAESVIISHMHSDHTAGLQTLAASGARSTFFVPARYASQIKTMVGGEAKIVDSAGVASIFPGCFVTDTAGNSMVGEERALALQTRGGTVVITGCAHPGVVEMVRQAQKALPGKVRLLVGGFHLDGKTDSTLRAIVGELRQLGVEGVLPTHCTGNNPTEIFRQEFGASFFAGGVGRTVTLPIA